MAATKHKLAEGESHQVEDAVRPSKKTKLQDGDADTDAKALKKQKKEKKDKKEKKEKKRKAEEATESAETPDAPEAAAADDDEDAERKAKKERKAAKKLEKAAKKEKKAKEAAAQEEETQEAVEAPAPEEKKKSKKDKKNKAAAEPGASSGTREYVQTMSLSELPQSEIDEFLTSKGVTITDPRTETVSLRPVIEFHHLPSTNLLEKNPSPFAGYKAPTPIQSASWPFTLSGRDVIGVAETGSGKTMAFAIPCVESVSAMGGRKGAVKAVVVSPTRELAMQTHEQLKKVAALVGLKCVCIYGGASKDDQRNLLQRGADIIVATPGRLKDFMSDETVDLGASAFVVLDEADRMLDKGFEEDIKQILGACRPREQRQTLMFTATWPQSVQSLASTFMVDPVKVTIGSGGKETASGEVELQANARITQTVEVVDPKDKEFRLLQILKAHQQGKARNDRILVFCLYKKEATRVEGFLQRKGINVGGIHGDLKQEQRTRSLEAFKTGKTPVLVATDVAARGLDIPEVKLVINVTVSRDPRYLCRCCPNM